MNRPKKKRYTVYLTEDSTERVKSELHRRESGLSQYIDSIIKDYDSDLFNEKAKAVLDRTLGQISVKELFGLLETVIEFDPDNLPRWDDIVKMKTNKEI